jgi:hypothetical protein
MVTHDYGNSDVLKVLSKVVEGTPRVETFEVTNLTSHEIAANAI